MSRTPAATVMKVERKAFKRQKFTARDFLDLDAADDDLNEEEDEDGSEDDFITRQVDLEYDDLTSHPARVLMEDVGRTDPHELAQRIEDRYRRISRASDANIADPVEGELIKWIHTAEACPPHTVVPIWRVQVTRGRESVVVCTVMKMEESAQRFDEIQSVTATPASRGSVYLECHALATVERIMRSVAFIRRGIPPVKIPLDDYRRLFEITDKPEVPIGSWVRYTRRGNYCGDLAWLKAYDPHTMGYTVWLIPRDLRWGVCMPRPSGLKRPRPPARVPRELLLPVSVGSILPPTALLEFDNRLYRYGFLIRDEVPADDICDDRVGPSEEELDLWETSPLYQLEVSCEKDPSSISSLFSRSLRAQRDALYMTGALMTGDRVRVVDGPWRDCIGWLLEISDATQTVTVDMANTNHPSLGVDLPSTIVMLDVGVGDLVEVCWGFYAGMCGWITSVDWVARSVVLVEHHAVPFPVPSLRETELEKRDELHHIQEWNVGMTCIRPKHLSSTLHATTLNEAPPLYPPRPSTKDPPENEHPNEKGKLTRKDPPSLYPPRSLTKDPPDNEHPNEKGKLARKDLPPNKDNSSKKTPATDTATPEEVVLPRARADPYENIEIFILKGKVGRGLCAIVKNTTADGNSVCVLTEGCAVNVKLVVEVEHVKERHTGFNLPQFVRSSPADREQARRMQYEMRQKRWTQPSANVALDSFSLEKLPSVETVWPDVAASSQELNAMHLAKLCPEPPKLVLSSKNPPSAPPVRQGGHWLLHPALRNKYLDVVVHEDSGWGGRYDNCVGIIECLPEIKRGKRGSVQIKFGIAVATRRFIKITNVFPLLTNEFEGHVSKADANSVLDVLGVYVVIIGPDDEGSSRYMGRIGYTTHGGDIKFWEEPDAHHSFPVASLCRSDPYPKKTAFVDMYAEHHVQWPRALPERPTPY
ncbi:hypothetical protein B0H11DRAFT_2244314 [Mycena galericulata]|nr:hypothetical protein B0H11DRAFT_2244314 [Mycena galericulata]